jgi:glycosyltransferase involved in cell wall biosynthesis
LTLRVLHFAETLPGGPASYFEEIAMYQIERYGGENVRFFVPSEGAELLPKVLGNSVYRFHYSGRSALELFLLLIKFRRQVRDFRPDIVHLHSTFAGLVGRVALVFGWRRPVIIYCAHGWAFSQLLSDRKKRLYANVERLLSLVTDAIINISRHDAQEAKAFGIPEKIQITIRNAVSAKAPQGLSPITPFPSQINLLFVGRHDSQKGLDILLSALESAQRPDIHLHVIGGSVIDSPAPVSDRVSMTCYGWQSRLAANAAMSNCDALVVPSRWEGFGLVVVEAMRAGRGSLVSDRGALPELVTSGLNGRVVSPNNVEQWTNLLKTLTSEELSSYRDAARKRFVSDFQADRLNSEIAALYERSSGS